MIMQFFKITSKFIQAHFGHVNIQETVNTYIYLTMKDTEKATAQTMRAWRTYLAY